jgi:hypothetical protein
MADFSKQWCDQNDPEMPYDFDIIEECKKLLENEWIPMICEGYGFTGIAKVNGECKVMMNNEWVLLDDVINNWHNDTPPY